jgi:hypothetical protein
MTGEEGRSTGCWLPAAGCPERRACT